jgi:membrane-associated phospholipid phosphatase
MKNNLVLLIALVGIVLFFQSCEKDSIIDSSALESAHSFDNSIPTTWNRLYLLAERFTDGYTPPVSARNNGYINYIAYESIVQASSGSHKSLKNSFSGLNFEGIDINVRYQWETVLHSAYERAFELYFPTAPAEIQFQIIETSDSISTTLEIKTDPEVYLRSREYGRYVADRIFAWSTSDSFGHEAFLNNTDDSYIPPSGIDKWQPTFPDFSAALLPNWGEVRSFSNIISVSVPPPPTFSEEQDSRIYQEAEVAMDMVNRIKQGDLEEDAWIAAFWSDDCPILTFSPAGRWVSITLQVLEVEEKDMMESVAAFAMVGMSLADAGIACWREKYRFNRLRPIDYIRNVMGVPDWNTIMCPDGSGNFFTPNFPAYPSGHAAFGGAAAVVLSQLFGDFYEFTDFSHDNRTEFNGKARSFNTFRIMAAENAYSRIPLGVHFSSDSNAGLNQGYAVGERITNLPWY